MPTITRWKKTCVCCGKQLCETLAVTPEEKKTWGESALCRCIDCAKELTGVSIPIAGTLQHGTGGGTRVIRETKTH